MRMKKVSIRQYYMEKDTTIDEVVSVCKRYPMMSKFQLVILKEAQDLSLKINELDNYANNQCTVLFWWLITNTNLLIKEKKYTNQLKKFGVVF